MNLRRLMMIGLALAPLGFTVGCQQKMADQPAHRAYEQSDLFEHQQSARPLEKGVIHRNQAVEGDPLVTWLTAAGKNPSVDPNWKKLVDPEGKTAPPAGAPTDVANFVAEFPFEMTVADLETGQKHYNAKCALCHGAAGFGNGKIVERGFLRPPSYHTDPSGKEMDWSTLKQGSNDLPAGYSRGFYRYGKKVALKDVPVGYIFQVITLGFGGMATHETQIPNPADRWRVAAYVRTLQLTQGVPAAELPAKAKEELSKVGGHK